ncbi:hypothetical protein Trydic_g4821 [Trypoxylus dichotomus]
MKFLVFLIVYLSVSNGQEKTIPTAPQQHDITTNIIEPISTNQAFNQYGFTPQAPTVSYPITTLPLTQTATPTQKQVFSPNPTIYSFPKTISTNIPVHATYQIADHPLVSSSAHAYPVQHSVEINHGDYDTYPNILVQHVEPTPKRNIPPITRAIHPQFVNPITPQQPLKPYNIPQQSNSNYQRPFNPQQPFHPYANTNGPNKIVQPLKPYLAPTINQNVNVRGPFPTAKPYIQNQNVVPQVVQKQYVPIQASTPTNLPYNFKALSSANSYQPLAKNSAQTRPSTLDSPSPLIPKPLPSPLRNLPVSPRPLPLPISGKSEVEEKGTDKEQDSKPVQEEEESEESGESEEDDEDDEEEGSYERDYPRARYNHNYHEDTEFDRKRYRPTFDAAKYIFNEEDEEESGESDEEEDEREERRAPPPRSKYKERYHPRRKEGPYREKPSETERRAPQKIRRPYNKRLASEGSEEQESKGSRWVPLRQNIRKERQRGYYK